MPITFKLKEANTSNEIDLIYDAATNASYQMHQGSQSLTGAIQALFHSPDVDAPSLVRLIPGIRSAFFRLNIEGSDAVNKADDTINKINFISRWIGGTSQRAGRYSRRRDVNRIELHIAIDGASQTTILPVIYGEPDFFGALFTVFGEDNKMAHSATIRLYVAEVGEGEPFTLRNDLASSPHMIEDSNSDNLPDGWSLVGTPSTLLTGTASGRWLIGGTALRVVTDTTTSEGVDTDLVTASASTDCVGYIWIYAASVNDNITLRMLDGSGGVIESKTFDPSSPSGYDKTAVGSQGGTWYRYTFSGQNAAANVRLRAFRASADSSLATTYFLDGAYLQLNATDIPDAFCSSSSLHNRYDVTSTNEEYINYIDVWGVPGDEPARARLALTSTVVASNPYRYHISRIYDGDILAAQRLYWFETLTGGGTIDATFSTPTSGTRSNGDYLRLTATAGGADGIFTVSLVDDEGLRKFARWPSRVFAITRTNNVHADTKLEIVTVSGGSTVIKSGAQHTTGSTWEWLDLGFINPSNAPLEFANTGGTPTISFDIDLQSATGWMDIDAIICIPIVDDGWLVGESTSLSANDIVYLLPETKQYFADNTATVDAYLGECFTVLPGVMNRYIINLSGTTDTHDLTNTFKAEFTITPQTRSLLGTQ